MSRHSSFISNSKRIFTILILKLIVAVLLVIVYLFFIVAPQYKGEYTGALIDKVERLRSIHEPKIVLIGNSNLSFGINSRIIENELEMPVVNMGLHGGLGNAFHEEMAKLNVTKGDVYILCHSEYDDNNSIPQPSLAWITLENHIGLWQLIRLDDIDELIEGLPIYIKRSTALYAAETGNIDPGGVYARSAYNEYGDIGVFREGNEYSFVDEVKAPEIGQVTAERINKLNRYLSDRGATLLVAGYPIANGSHTVHTDEFIRFQEELAASLECAIISNFADYMLDYSYFYNTSLHLNSEGANIRTRQLIDDIKKWQISLSETSMDMDQYINIVADNELSRFIDVNEYFSALSEGKDRYTIMVSVQNPNENNIKEIWDAFILSSVHEDIVINIFNKMDISDVQAMIIENGRILKISVGSGSNSCQGKLDNSLEYSVSGGMNSSILLQGREYSKQINGINLVIYSNETHRIIDEAALIFGTDGSVQIVRS